MSSLDEGKTEPMMVSWLSWERWALQSRSRRIQVLLLLALGIQIVVWAAWSVHTAHTSGHTPAPAHLGSNESEFALASAWMSEPELLSLEIDPAQQAGATHSEMWLDMGLEAKRLGLIVVEPDEAKLLDDDPLQASDTAWVVRGPFAEAMRWVTQVAFQHPQLMMGELQLSSAEEQGWAEIKVRWQIHQPGFALAAATPTFHRTPNAAQTWYAHRQRLLQPNAWPDFEGLNIPLGLSSFILPWPDSVAEEWQRDRRHVLSQTPLNALRWKGAMMTRGRVVGLVAVGSDVWTVERGDTIGQGRYRVVDITADYMVLHMAVPNAQGQVDIRETVIGAHTETGTP